MQLFRRLKAACPDAWETYVHHEFVKGLGDGTLPAECFRHYLIQDYIFLIHFARAYALAVYKGRDLTQMRAAYDGLKAILDTEMDLHVRLCGQWGMTKQALASAPEATATLAYTRYVLETGLRGDLLDLHVALAPCVIGYAEIGANLAALVSVEGPNNPYGEWIAEYAGDDYQSVAAEAAAVLDRLASEMNETRFPQLATIFEQATRLEIDFWNMGLELSN